MSCREDLVIMVVIVREGRYGSTPSCRDGYQEKYKDLEPDVQCGETFSQPFIL